MISGGNIVLRVYGRVRNDFNIVTIKRNSFGGVEIVWYIADINRLLELRRHSECNKNNRLCMFGTYLRNGVFIERPCCYGGFCYF